MALSGRDAFLKITSATATTSTGLACTRSTGVAGNGYVQINSTAARYLDNSTTHDLYVEAAGSTTLVPSSQYTVNHLQGKFEWVSGDPSTGTYTADVRYLTATSVGGGREWSMNIDQDAFEITEFGSGGWREFQPNMAGAQIQISRYWQDSEFFDRLNTSDNFIVELGINSVTNERYQTYAYVQADQIGASVDSLVGETINLVADGQVYYST